MPLPFGCPQDALYDTVRWNNKGVKFREHTFLANRLVPAALRDNRVRVSVAARGEAPPPSTAHAVHLRYGTPMADVRAAVLTLALALALALTLALTLTLTLTRCAPPCYWPTPQLAWSRSRRRTSSGCAAGSVRPRRTAPSTRCSGTCTP